MDARTISTIRARGIHTLWVVGFETQYCFNSAVHTALDAGFVVNMVTDGTADYGREPAKTKKATLMHLHKAGANLVRLASVEKTLQNMCVHF